MPYEISISGIDTKFNKCIDWVACKVDTPPTSKAKSNYVGNYINISGFIGTDEVTIDLYKWAMLPVNDINVIRNVQLTVKDANDNITEKISFPNAFVQYYRESYSRDRGLGKFDLQLKQRIDKNGDVAVSDTSAENKAISEAEAKHIENILGKAPASGILNEWTSSLGRFARREITQDDVIGKLDSSFVELNQTKKIEAAFKEIEYAFGPEYASKIRNQYNKVNHQSLSAGNLKDMGEFNFSSNGTPYIALSKNFGNSKMMANSILHE
ncbi:MAG TPA: hypothetical protein VF941_24705, partial [Clostridia bacterium]